MVTQNYDDGVLSDTQIAKLVTEKNSVIQEAYIQPAGVDIPSLFSEVYEMKTFSLPSQHEKVEDVIKKFCNNGTAKRHKGSVLEPGSIYIAKLHFVADGMQYYGRTNTKSTIGRWFMHTRLLVDYCSQYDVIPVGYTGPVWM